MVKALNANAFYLGESYESIKLPMMHAHLACLYSDTLRVRIKDYNKKNWITNYLICPSANFLKILEKRQTTYFNIYDWQVLV